MLSVEFGTRCLPRGYQIENLVSGKFPATRSIIWLPPNGTYTGNRLIRVIRQFG